MICRSWGSPNPASAIVVSDCGIRRWCRSNHARRCHGDLHLRYICLLGGEPRLFGCIEFNEQIATLHQTGFVLTAEWGFGDSVFCCESTSGFGVCIDPRQRGYSNRN
ncbi:hypothetical protein CN059_29575 [Sinorhizobium medicae]|nr:hypothetical protein CN165_18895 [Sinorhizobium medicae]RVQ40579.1 hypothetical protein CN059_29575 [Sinorhizobium medicae]RVQ75798.1 hypothetical protein CN244_07160 [Sinorhizobium medicae]